MSDSGSSVERGGLVLGADRVDDIVDRLGLSDEARATARNYAERADMEHPINKSPSTIAASAVYLAAMVCNEKCTQMEVSLAADVCKSSIRDCYMEIARAEGITMKRPESSSRQPGRLAKVREVFGRDG